MRVLKVSEVDGDGEPVVLHPEVTVLRTSDEARRTWLAEVLGRLSTVDERVTGEIEAHGIGFPLDQTSLALLALGDVDDAIVRAQDLPGYESKRNDAAAAAAATESRRDELGAEIDRNRQALAAAVARRDRAVSDLAQLQRGEGAAQAVLERAEQERAAAQAEHQAAVEERSRLERSSTEAETARGLADAARVAAADQLDAARIAHREAMTAATSAAATVEELRSVDLVVTPEQLTAARERLERAEEAAAADTVNVEGELGRQQAALEGRRAEVRRLQEALGTDDVVPLADALDGLLSASDEAAPIVAAVALADTWRDLHQQLRALDAGVAPEEQAAEQRVATARQNVSDAEVDFNQPVLTPEQVDRVEAAHAEVLEAQDRSEGRFGGSRARKRLDEARSEERRVLERLGFSTYADYMMSSSSRGVGPANRAVLDIARQALVLAIGELEALPGAAERTRRRAELLQRRDAVANQVAALIGHEPTGPEAEEELRELRQEVAPDEAALTDLAERLEEVGVVVGPPPHDREDLVLLARSYLAEHRTSEDRRAEAAEAISALDEMIAACQAAGEREDEEVPDLTALPPLAQPVPVDAELEDGDHRVSLREARWAEVEAARHGVEDLESALAEHRDAAERLEEAEAELAATTSEAETQAAARGRGRSRPMSTAAVAGPREEAIASRWPEAEDALDRARVVEAAAAGRLGQGGDRSDLDAMIEQAEATLASVEAAVTEAAAAEQASASAHAEAEAAHAVAAKAWAATQAAAAAVDRGALVEEIDWALLSRLAGLRSVGVAGSVPLVLAEPFATLTDDEVTAVLGKVATMASAVQVVVISDRPAIVAWASDLGPERAAVVAA